jgi:tRNA-2-methylthio-N6-dimethylallyladenosine synthase
MKSFQIITFGCQMNEHDSERMAGILESQGLVPSSATGDTELVILNTCSIREKAEQKFYSELGRLQRLKRENPKLRIGVAGCIAQQEGSKILSRAPFVDFIVGPSDLPKLSSMIRHDQSRSAPVVEIQGDPEYHRKPVPASRAGGVKAWVSIMYGCDNFCTYCVVPYLRGRERSRPAGDILAEVRDLSSRGYREITLLGQNVNSYGKGLKEGTDFPSLLSMVNDIPGIERIRFVTSHPRDLSEGLITAIGVLPKVCEALHLPVQSGSDRILHAMNRRYTREEYLDKVSRLRDAVPGIALTSDIIVGFPGETEQDFEDTMALLREVEYDGVFAFRYSKRPNTAALKLSGHIPERVKEARLGKVLELQRSITLGKNRMQVDTVQEVLLDGFSKKGGSLTGRTRGNKVVNVAGPDSLLGSLVQVKIKSAGPNSLAGELCE